MYVHICPKSPLNASTEVVSGNDAVPFTIYTSMNSAHVHMNERDGEITASQGYTTHCTCPLETSVYGPSKLTFDLNSCLVFPFDSPPVGSARVHCWE